MTFESFISIGSLIAAILPSAVVLITFRLSHRRIIEIHGLVNSRLTATLAQLEALQIEMAEIKAERHQP